MEKHQIVRQRRITNTPWKKFCNKAALITSAVGVVVAVGYNYWRSDVGTYIMSSGYYHDEELQQQAMRMSLMTMFTLKPRKTLVNENIKEEDAIGEISQRAVSIVEADLNP